MWLARDRNGWLYLFYEKPVRYRNLGWDLADNDIIDPAFLDKSLFPNLTWDDEPIEVELKIKNHGTL